MNSEQEVRYQGLVAKLNAFLECKTDGLRVINSSDFQKKSTLEKFEDLGNLVSFQEELNSMWNGLAHELCYFAEERHMALRPSGDYGDWWRKVDWMARSSKYLNFHRFLTLPRNDRAGLLSDCEGLGEIFNIIKPIYHLFKNSQYRTQIKFAEIKDSLPAVRAIVREFHNSNSNISDSALNFILGIDEQWLNDGGNDWTRFGSHEQLGYGGTPYNTLRSFFRTLDLQPETIVYDLGTGYGKPIFYGAMTTPAKFRGIEIVPERVEQCKITKDRLKLENAKFINSDVKKVDFTDGDVFYLFNPFSDRTLDYVLGKLKQISERKPITVGSFFTSGLHYYFEGWSVDRSHSHLAIYKSQ